MIVLLRMLISHVTCNCGAQAQRHAGGEAIKLMFLLSFNETQTNNGTEPKSLYSEANEITVRCYHCGLGNYQNDDNMFRVEII